MNFHFTLRMLDRPHWGRHWQTCLNYLAWLQTMTNRRDVGELRYEKGSGPIRRQRYLTRLKREVQAYQETGNVEHLLNVANYAFLESEAPERVGGCHWDSMVESVAREVGVGANGVRENSRIADSKQGFPD